MREKEEKLGMSHPIVGCVCIVMRYNVLCTYLPLSCYVQLSILYNSIHVTVIYNTSIKII